MNYRTQLFQLKTCGNDDDTHPRGYFLTVVDEEDIMVHGTPEQIAAFEAMTVDEKRDYLDKLADYMQQVFEEHPDFGFSNLLKKTWEILKQDEEDAKAREIDNG